MGRILHCIIEQVSRVSCWRFLASLSNQSPTLNEKILIFDLRSFNPLRIKEHMYGSPILNIKWHETLNSEQSKLITTDEHIVRIWDSETAQSLANPFAYESYIEKRKQEELYLERADRITEVTAIEYDGDGDYLRAVGSNTGKILINDLRSSNPLRIKDHMYGSPILNIKWHKTLNSEQSKLITADEHITRIWDSETIKRKLPRVRGFKQATRFFSSTAGETPELSGKPPLHEDFKTDKYENEFLERYYGEGGGPSHIIIAMCWPVPLHWVQLTKLGERLYIHGPWFEPDKVLTKEQEHFEYDALFSGFDEDADKYKEMILYYWVDFGNPTCFQAAKSFITDEWRTHGLPAGVNAKMFLYIGLLLRVSMHDSCGITVGHTMQLSLVFEQAKIALSNVQLFGKKVGADVYPQVKAMADLRYDKKIRKAHPSLYPYLIHDIRPHFARTKVKGKDGAKPTARFQVVSILPGMSLYKGNAQDDKKLVTLFPNP